MKRILIVLLCIVLFCAIPITAFAESETNVFVEEEETVEDTSTTTEEVVTEGEHSGAETTTSVTTEEIIKWAETHLEEISVIITLIFSLIYQVRKHASLNKSIAKCNNNAITIANDSKNAIDEARASMETAKGAVTGYDEKIVTLLETFKTTAEDKTRLENELVEIRNYLKVSTEANIEFANELAELLGLSNIPNYKKQSLGERHLAKVKAIKEAATKAEVVMMEAEGVNSNVGKEA